MKKHFKKYKNEYISISILIVATLILLTILLKLWNFDFTIPIKYDGLDETSTLVNSKMFLEQTWCLSTDKLGAPLGAEFYDFSANVLHNFDLLTLKFFVMITGNAVVAYNLEFLSIFFLTALISYLVMRELKISNWISVSASLIFAFLPYLFIRGTEHLVLTTCYFVPLSLLLCTWIYERDDILIFDNQFFRNKRNWLVLLFALLIANNGIAYYPFFTCFLLLVTAISKSVKSKKLGSFLKAFSVIGAICVFMIINMIPILIYNLQNGSNSYAVVRSGFLETEIYGLKIIQLFLPVNDHNIPALTKIIQEYNTSAPFINENVSAYLGIAGICGFLFLMLVLFSPKSKEKYNRLELLSEMNFIMVLLGTGSGICTMFSILVSDLLRAYNRISIFIGFVCILAFAIALDSVYKKYKNKWIIVIGVTFSVFCIFEQFPKSNMPTYEKNSENFLSDEALVTQLEKQVSDGAMIYQLPYHEYPEGGTVYTMYDYQLFTGFIHSKNLKWSYGSIKGRKSDEWNKNIAALEIPEMVRVLRDSNFEGIYIDRRAYEPYALNELENMLDNELNTQAVISDNGNLSYYIIK